MYLSVSDLKTIIKRVLGIDSFTLDLKLGDIPEWDSLRHYVLMCEIENEYQIRFLPEEIEEANSYKKLYDAVYKKLEEKES
jgi:acyl carrier protein